MNQRGDAQRVLRLEAEAILRLADGLGEEFDRAVEILAGAPGKVVLTGMGKSGLVARKIASTLASTGTAAVYLHPAEGVHGDLGVLVRGDVLVALSHSGETEELAGLLPSVRHLELPLLAVTGKRDSTLARRADVVLHLPVEQEGCPLNLAPMASTTAALALGDALAAALMRSRGFTAEDFARLHPAGSLGRRLNLRVRDLMHEGDAVPRVSAGTSMREVLLEMTSKRLGFTGVFGPEGTLLGVVTDGDLRRALEVRGDLLGRPVEDVMTDRPKCVPASMRAAEALEFMEDHAITSLFVTGGATGQEVEGVLHIHDLVRSGLR